MAKMTKDEAVALLAKAELMDGGIYIAHKDDILGQFQGDHGSGPEDVIDQAETKEDGSIDWSEADSDLKRMVRTIRKYPGLKKLYYLMAEEAEDFLLLASKPKKFKSGGSNDARDYRYSNMVISVGKIVEKDAVLIFALEG